MPVPFTEHDRHAPLGESAALTGEHLGTQRPERIGVGGGLSSALERRRAFAGHDGRRAAQVRRRHQPLQQRFGSQVSQDPLVLAELPPLPEVADQ